MDFSYPYTALHLRRGNDKLAESREIENVRYLEYTVKYFDKFLHNETLKRVYVASDDKYIVARLIKIRPGYTYM